MSAQQDVGGELLFLGEWGCIGRRRWPCSISAAAESLRWLLAKLFGRSKLVTFLGCAFFSDGKQTARLRTSAVGNPRRKISRAAFCGDFLGSAEMFVWRCREEKNRRFRESCIRPSKRG